MSTSNFRAPSIEDFNRAIELNPNDAHAYGNRGNIYSELGHLSLAADEHIAIVASGLGFYHATTTGN